MSVITATGVHKSYGKVTVLEHIDFTLEPGETVALLGPNGAGKTTTVEILAGFVPRDGGEVNVLGSDPAIASDPKWRARIGIGMQVSRDHSKWRVAELLTWVLSHYDPTRHPHTLETMLDTFGLREHAHKSILALSGGLRRRLDLACAIIGRPDLLILDEPTTGLDPAARRAVHDIVTDQVDEGVSLLLTTHDLAEAERLADRIVILDRGRIVAQGSPEALRLAAEGLAEITWSQRGERFVHAAQSPEDFLRDLLQSAEITDLEVRRRSLEDAYLALFDARATDRSDLRSAPSASCPVTPFSPQERAQ